MRLNKTLPLIDTGILEEGMQHQVTLEAGDARPEVIVDAGRVSVDAACPLRGCLYLSESRIFISIRGSRLC